MAQSFAVNDFCISCGICSRVCPVGNITVVNGKPRFGTACLACYACIHKNNEKGEKRWRHLEVSLDEIISANNME